MAQIQEAQQLHTVIYYQLLEQAFYFWMCVILLIPNSYKLSHVTLTEGKERVNPIVFQNVVVVNFGQ